MRIADKGKLSITGAIIGIAAVVLTVLGNPGNMGFCIACFLRDTAGAMHLHTAPIVEYVRPEIIGIIIGGTICACINWLANWPVAIQTWSVVLSFAVCTVTGVFFGWYPAKKAAALDPIDALRYE